MKTVRVSMKSLAMGGCALGVLAAAASPAAGAEFAVAPQELQPALQEFASQGDQQVLFSSMAVLGKRTAGFTGEASPEDALQRLLSGTDLVWSKTADGALLVMTEQEARAKHPQFAQTAGGGSGATVEALIVTAQKREEDIQDVPIAISAFSQEDLTRSQVAGGPDLMTQVPNMTFTKTNFSSYSIQLRGIGTQAISATTDPAVAVAFNNTPFVRNRFFEQEFYDLQRVEVLRGPQGTLYGRNATAGVVNIISAKPKFAYEAKLSADVANYNSTRLEGMINAPLVEDAVALRLAGAWTKREGFVTNQITGNPIDGRDLWSTRVSLRFTPNDRLDANLIWEHFEEDDDRLRSGKQLCNTHEITDVAGFPTTHFQGLANTGQGGSTGSLLFAGIQGTFSQGCQPASLYSPDSFQTPNGISLPYYLPLSAVALPAALDDPYVSRSQSHDLRVIESTVDPSYRAKSDTVEVQLNIDLSDTLSLSSETAWASDFVFSTQDFNRFNTAPGAWDTTASDGTQPLVERGILSEDGVFCDPQVGCADRLIAVDLSTATSQHFSQELRLASNYEGPFNFSLGANFLRYDTEDKYYVFINSLSLIAAINSDPSLQYVGGVTDNATCLLTGMVFPDPSTTQPILGCTYMDPNPISNLNDQGHNYFLSRNPYKLISYAVFGEAYYSITDDLKVTGGLRWTVDKKEAPRIPSWVLASGTAGYPVMEVTEQEWRKPTGRLTIDWGPDLAFTDETLVYGSFAHGYKAGGANPPPYGVAIYLGGDVASTILEESATNPKTFDAEYVNAFEIGAKNTLLDRRATLNLAAFYYDYTGYQISQIVDRSATNLNFDAEVWGLEIEADWRPLENLRLGFKGGYENTRVADGERAIDIMDRTAGTPGWVVVRPFPSIPSNCVLPEWLFVGNPGGTNPNPYLANLGGMSGGNPGACESYLLNVDPVTRRPYVLNPPQTPSQMPFTHRGSINYAAYDPDVSHYPGWPTGVPLGTTYPGWDPSADYGNNRGQGFFKDLSGKELPNAPHFTATVTADYTIPLPNDWLATLHTDLYYQSEAWTRIFNTEGYDKLKAYSNINLAAIFTNEDAGWTVMGYVKNVLDRDSITGAFLNSDDTGLTTNVFLTEPRLYGLRVTKAWNGGPWWTGAVPDHAGPYPLTIEIGGQIQKQDAPYAPVIPNFADNFSPGLQQGESFNGPLDWGDGREVRLILRPGGSPWTMSAGVRYGRANTDTTRTHKEELDEGSCAFLPGSFFASYCDPATPSPYLEASGIDALKYPTLWSDAAVRSRESHTLVDFTVGRDVGLGAGQGLSSTLSAGLRFARFNSTTDANMSGIPDWYLPEGFFYAAYGLYVPHTTRYDAALHADRTFEGTGPTVSWAAALPVLGGENQGVLAIDWNVGGGVLFGTQEAALTGHEQSGYFSGQFGTILSFMFDRSDVDVGRSRSATVPFADVSLGLTYEIQRIKLSAGYRWEQYFDVLDVGQDEAKKADRTIDGPYFKLSVGFGG